MRGCDYIGVDDNEWQKQNSPQECGNKNSGVYSPSLPILDPIKTTEMKTAEEEQIQMLNLASENLALINQLRAENKRLKEALKDERTRMIEAVKLEIGDCEFTLDVAKALNRPGHPRLIAQK